jgi:predicted exporter
LRVDASLSLFHPFHWCCGGPGLDYALFFEHASVDPPNSALHALLVCSISTLLVFAAGTVDGAGVAGDRITVSLGVVSNFVLLLLTRERRVHDGHHLTVAAHGHGAHDRTR